MFPNCLSELISIYVLIYLAEVLSDANKHNVACIHLMQQAHSLVFLKDMYSQCEREPRMNNGSTTIGLADLYGLGEQVEMDKSASVHALRQRDHEMGCAAQQRMMRRD